MKPRHVLCLLACGAAPAHAIPSPDLVINAFASVVQPAGLPVAQPGRRGICVLAVTLGLGGRLLPLHPVATARP